MGVNKHHDLFIYYFYYKTKLYQKGTRLVFTGHCSYKDKEIYLENVAVTYKLSFESNAFFYDDNNNIYMCNKYIFENCIVRIIEDENKSETSKNEVSNEFYWTDDSVASTLWYILIMLFATIFNERIFIWIFTTFIWYNSTFKKK